MNNKTEFDEGERGYWVRAQADAEVHEVFGSTLERAYAVATDEYGPILTIALRPEQV
jgi:hypothetical protein